MIIYVKVKPCARENSLEKLEDGSFLARVKERAEEGRANLSLIKLIAREFGVSQSKVNIKNKTGRKKVIEIEKRI